ncbi:MAG: cupin domain-containing protein [Solirubrobacteraceae bacterium]
MSTATAAPTAHPLWFLDNLAYVHVAGNQSGESFSLSELVGARGNMPPLHVHHRDDETFYVIAGEVTLFYGHQEVSVGPGQALLAPRDIPHTYRVDSDRARWLVINSPSGFEQFLFEASEPAPSPELPPQGRPADPQALAQAAAAYDIEILGPPGVLPTGL